MSDAEAVAIIELLGLEPHPEGGRFVETWRHRPADGGRGAGTAIYFLLRRGEESRWHRIDSVEVWHYYAGAPLELEVAGDDGRVAHVLGPDVVGGQRPQVIVPAGGWQRARSTGAYTLVGCTVSPAFEMSAFELAPPGWEPAG